jgi:hypothetical protein
MLIYIKNSVLKPEGKTQLVGHCQADEVTDALQFG